MQNRLHAGENGSEIDLGGGKGKRRHLLKRRSKAFYTGGGEGGKHAGVPFSKGGEGGCHHRELREEGGRAPPLSGIHKSLKGKKNREHSS